MVQKSGHILRFHTAGLGSLSELEMLKSCTLHSHGGRKRRKRVTAFKPTHPNLSISTNLTEESHVKPCQWIKKILCYILLLEEE